MNRIQKSRARGTTMVEMLVTVIVMSIASMAIFGLLITTMSQSKRLNSKLDGLDEARNALEKIGRDVRMARNLGDVFGTGVGGQVGGSQVFPSAANPLYGAGQTPPEGGSGGGAGWPWSINSYDMNDASQQNRLLVVQIPVFDANGFPTVIPAGTGNPADATRPKENVETHIYRVVADPNNPGEFLLQWAKVPGMLPGQTGNNPAKMMGVRPSQAQTLVSGIIGPLSNAGNPRVFQYIRKNVANPDDTIQTPATIAADYQGVAVSLEIRQHQDTTATNSQYKSPGVMAVKEEIYLRNNNMATIVGMPSTATN